MITPFKVPRILQSLYPGLEWKQNASEKKIYLTFDDGPHPEITRFVLQQLEKYEAKGTFFCVGENVQRYPEVAAEIRLKGHTLANHSHNHLKGWNYSAAAYVKNILLASEFIPLKIFRPPYGRITRRQIALLKAAGYRIIMWNLLSCDYLQNLDRVKSLNSLKENTKSGSIVVFHDSLKASENLHWLLPKYLEFLSENGFKPVAIK